VRKKAENNLNRKSILRQDTIKLSSFGLILFREKTQKRKGFTRKLGGLATLREIYSVQYCGCFS
jgi:predicted adenine nucleotide alpha hydrolase (AANH) superfamily ATPase